MLYVLGEQGFEMAAPEEEHPVETFAPHGADHALADGVGPGRTDGAPCDSDDVGSKAGVEGNGEPGVAAADEDLDVAGLVGALHREVWGLAAAVARRGGNPRRRQIDLAIAATAQVEGVPLLTEDVGDFQIIDDLFEARRLSDRVLVASSRGEAEPPPRLGKTFGWRREDRSADAAAPSAAAGLRMDVGGMPHAGAVGTRSL